MVCKKCGNLVNDKDKKCGVCGELVPISINPEDTSSQRYNLTINRVKSSIGCLMTFSIYVDGSLVTKLKNGESTIISITAGNHVLAVDNKNPIDVVISGDTEAEVKVLSAGNFGFSKISGPGISESVSSSNVTNKKDRTNATLIVSIVLPIISAILMYNFQFYIQFWVYGLVIGYAIVNMACLKENKEANKSGMIKNIIAIVISVISIILTGVLVF